jgi:hypothetical protein
MGRLHPECSYGDAPCAPRAPLQKVATSGMPYATFRRSQGHSDLRTFSFTGDLYMPQVTRR